MRRRSSMSQNPTTRPTLGAAPDTTGTISQIHSDANQTASFVHPRFRVRTVWRGDHAGDGWNGLRALGEKGAGQAQGLPLRERLGVRTPVAVSTVRTVHEGRAYEGGRCGGNPPAQGRAEGPTAQMRGESEEERGVGDTVCSAGECDWS